ncbi:MAG: FadR/GntR family transcriptional regulator [Anaerolineae bacterium]
MIRSSDGATVTWGCFFVPEGGYTRVKSVKAYEEVANRLEREIITGELAAGAKLPPLTKLAEQFGVNVSVVREAVMSLKARRLLDIRHGRGTFVSDTPVRSLLRPFELVVPLTSADMLALAEARMLIEVPAAGMAALRTQMDLAEVEEAQETVRRLAQGESWAEFFRADSLFHLAIARCVGNRFVPELLEPVLDLVMTGRTYIYVEGAIGAVLPRDLAVAQHNGILSAMRAGDGPGASEAMRKHLQTYRENARVLEAGKLASGGPGVPSEEERR